MIFCLFLISVFTIETILRRDKKAPPPERDMGGDLRSLAAALEEHGRGTRPATESLEGRPSSVEYTVSSDVRAK